MKHHAITSFSGENRFLSNFWPALVYYGGLAYPSVEHAYVAAKTVDIDLRLQIRDTETPGQVKRLGRKIELRSDWEEIKVDTMRYLVTQKFRDNKELGDLLLATGDLELIEGNTWGDTFWGVCNGVGSNRLGHILMEVRDALKTKTR